MGVRLLTLAEAAAILAVVTGSIHVPPPAWTPEPPADPGTAVLQVKEWRSLVGPWETAEIPEITILGGGQVITPAGQDGSLQRATEHILTPDGYRQIYRLAHQAGLARNQHLSSPTNVIDGSLLVVTLRSDGRTYTTTATNLWSDDVGPRGPRGPRGRIARFRQALSTLIASTTTAPYRPAMYAALANGGYGTKESQAAARPWPGETDLAAGIRTHLGACTLLASVPPEATRTTEWMSSGEVLLVTLRPLLPHERTCTDLDKNTA
jgi:hypothetical protein